MSDSLGQPAYAAIERWKQVGAELSDTHRKYLDLCRSLKAASLQQGSHPLDLASHIDSTLGSLHTEIDQHLALSRTALARTRNELVSPLHRLPEELQSQIFLNVVISSDIWHDLEHDKPRWMEDSLKAMQRCLYNLLHVCSMWRNVILARDVFQPTVGTYGFWRPTSHHPSYTDICVSEIQGGNLNLAVALPLPSDFEWDALRRHVRLFRSINILDGIHSPSFALSQELINVFLESMPSQLAELSIYQYTTKEYSQRFMPSEKQHIVRHNSYYWTPFLEIVKSLSVLRISGEAFSLMHMAFSSRLVELRLQNISIGYDSEFSEFLNVLSSAPELRDLKLISLITLHDKPVPWGAIQQQQHIMLPNLQSILLEELYFNTLELLLRWLTPGSCRLTLYLTGHSTEVLLGNSEEETVGIEKLCSLLRPITVDTLALSGDDPPVYTVRSLLESMPTLKSLKIQLWVLDSEGRDALKRPEPQTTSFESNTGVFPKLEQLHVVRLVVGHEGEKMLEEGLKDIVVSHSIQKMVLGDVYHDYLNAKGLQGNEPICVWLRTNVPEFHLNRAFIHAPEFYSHIWQLW
ncbi:hypothetical protein B0J17DRAFT_627540 [Rhizoctonia solani]|nr:hypothetical protein B0J17DRAFT_627540 [Rhizoctonia solani]